MTAPLDDELVAAIVNDVKAAYVSSQAVAGVAVVMGAGVRVGVRFGHLVVEDGVGPHRRTRRFPRVPSDDTGFSRLIVEADSGVVTLDALAWCRAADVSVVGIGREGEQAWASVPAGGRDARLTRALALAGSADDDPVGLAIVRRLLRAKIAGEANVLMSGLIDDVPELERAARTLVGLRDSLDDTGDIDESRQLEAAAASIYWDAWSKSRATVPHFSKADAAKVPQSWAVYPGRRSRVGVGSSNRRATHPTNAILNYCHTLARSEARLALCRLGLDPTLGVLHRDTQRRHSLACDVQEAIRPVVEAFVLRLLSARSFRRADFLEGPSGEVRLGMTLRQELCQTTNEWTRAVAPHAEGIRVLLAEAVRQGAGSTAGVPDGSPLSGARRREAAAVTIERKKAASRGRKAAMAAIRPAQRPPRTSSTWSCPDCGGAVTNHRHVRCDACIGSDPRQSPEVRGRRGAAIAARKRALIEWEHAHPDVAYDPELFKREILPRLAGVKLSEIMEATGCSKASASDIRRGKRTPHVSAWPALRRLAGVDWQVVPGGS